MLEQEYKLLNTLLLTDEREIKNIILEIPKKWIDRDFHEFLKAYKYRLLKDYEIDSLVEDPRFKPMSDTALAMDVFATLSDVKGYIKTLESRYLKEQASRIASLDDTRVKDGIISLNRELLEGVEDQTRRADMRDIARLIEDGRKAKNLVKTGLFKIDKFLEFSKKDLHIIGARPAVGKSAFSLFLALAMAKKHKGLWLSLEMPLIQMGQRIIANKSKIPLELIKSEEKNFTREQEQAYDRAVQELAEMNLSMYDGSFYIDQIEELVRKEKLDNEIEFVFVDYLQLVGSHEKGRFEKVTDVSVRLKKLAKDYDVAVIALSQLNREIEKRSGKEIYLSDFRESGQIEQDASTIIALQSEDLGDGKAVLSAEILKNRQGRLGTLKYQYHKKNQTFYEITNYGGEQ